MIRHGAGVLGEVHGFLVGFGDNCFIFNRDCQIQEIYSLGWLFKFPFQYAKFVNFLFELFLCWFKLVSNPDSHNVINKTQHITNSMAAFTSARGNPFGKDRESSHWDITSIAWFVSMLVYADLVSAVNSQLFLGS